MKLVPLRLLDLIELSITSVKSNNKLIWSCPANGLLVACSGISTSFFKRAIVYVSRNTISMSGGA